MVEAKGRGGGGHNVGADVQAHQTKARVARPGQHVGGIPAAGRVARVPEQFVRCGQRRVGLVGILLYENIGTAREGGGGGNYFERGTWCEGLLRGHKTKWWEAPFILLHVLLPRRRGHRRVS